MTAPSFSLGELEQSFRQLGEDRYIYQIPDAGLTLEVDRLRRDRHELIGELAVSCDLAGARDIDGIINVADFNFSSARARQDRARLLKSRSNTPTIDWEQVLEGLCINVRAHDRSGQPAIMLRDIPRPSADAAIDVDGIPLLRDHPTIFFGDGGSAKSLLALWRAGRLDQQAYRVGLFDWELSGEDHRLRLEQLFGEAMPAIVYVRCYRPLVHEADRLKRIVREHGLTHAVYDSIAFACDGPPEAADTAASYFRAVRSIGIGSTHVAHITKGENGDQRPFGSAFWHNGARATWFVKLADSTEPDRISIGLFNRKANLGAKQSPVGFEIRFTPERITFSRVNLADVDSLAVKLPIHQRMRHLLQAGSLTTKEIAEELDVPENSITQAVKRKDRWFTKFPDQSGVYRIGLLKR